MKLTTKMITVNGLNIWTFNRGRQQTITVWERLDGLYSATGDALPEVVAQKLTGLIPELRERAHRMSKTMARFLTDIHLYLVELSQ